MVTITRIGLALGAVVTVVVLWFALTRDIRYSRAYMGDLRNRIVGARIIEDGGSPYFYKWKPGDPTRYYDPQAFDIYLPSISTSTPFLHRLLMPVADLPQATIMRIWMVVLWLVLAAMAGYAWSLALTPRARAAVAVTALLFLLTNGWELQVRYGQTYLLIAGFAMLVLALWRWPLLAGMAAAALVMVRLNTGLFLIPFLFVRPRKVAFFLPGVIALCWLLLSPRERGLWTDYGAMLEQQVRIHQNLPVPTQSLIGDPHYRYWEGLDMDTARARMAADPVRIYSENGNVFVLYQKLTGRRMPLGLLGASGLLAAAGVFALFVWRRPPTPFPTTPDLTRIAILGFCLYMISDLFSPVYRHQYYTVQWLMPLLLAASLYRGRLDGRYAGLLTGLFLNIVHVPYLRMGNTIGEYVFLICLVAIALDFRAVDRRNAPPAGLP